MVEEQKSLISTGFVLNTNVATLSLFCNTNTAASGTVMVEQSCWNSNGETVIVEQWRRNSGDGTVMVELSWWNSDR